MKTLYMYIGLPGTGKSTYYEKTFGIDTMFNKYTSYISTDKYIEYYAHREGITYNEAFDAYIKPSTDFMERDLKAALKDDSIATIVWDQTNLTRKSRARKLEKIPSDFYKIACVFPVPANIKERLNGRKGKFISDKLFETMQKSYESPVLEEGFDQIWRIKNE